MRGRNLKKFLEAIELLGGPCGASVDELSRRLGIGKRSVYNLLKFLQDDMLFSLEEETPLGAPKRFRLEKEQYRRLSDMKVPDMNLSMAEIIALYFIRSGATQFQGTEIEQAIERAFSKLDCFVPEGMGHRLETIKSLFVTPTKFTKDYSDKQEIIDVLIEAICSHRTCKIMYHAFTKDTTKSFIINPLHFFEREGGLYILVRVPKYGDIRTLAVERILTIELLMDNFIYPEGFDPNELLETAFNIFYGDPIEAQIWFSADQARYIKERRWAKMQTIVETPDGSLILTIKTSGWEEVKRWVLSWGADAKVLNPKEFVDWVGEELKKASAKY
jgi:predicted DNA-binding transcriptional regulator YafY